MSKRRSVERHMISLHDISEIMNSMKNLALLETRKISRLRQNQLQQTEAIETMLADMQCFYLLQRPSITAQLPVIIVIGSERGFCGDYNQSLLAALQPYLQAQQPATSIIGVGNRLGVHLANIAPQSRIVTGANVAEEIESVINGIVAVLTELQQSQAGSNLTLTVLHRQQEQKPLQGMQILPPLTSTAIVPAIDSRYPPQLNLAAAQMFSELLDHYLFAKLHQVLYDALLAENEHRLHHLDGALHRIEQRRDELALRRNSLRQEEIIEEIEVILLSAESLRAPEEV